MAFLYDAPWTTLHLRFKRFRLAMGGTRSVILAKSIDTSYLIAIQAHQVASEGSERMVYKRFGITGPIEA